jgi:hypothetical protein
MSFKLIDDLPQSRGQRISLDETSNFYLKDSNIADSYVIVETAAQEKSSYDPQAAGTKHPKKNDYYLFEETVTDIGGGLFKIQSKYASVPTTWYDFEVIQLPYLKYWGLSVIGGGGITVGTSYLWGYLNVQSTDDLFYFNSEGFTDSKTKSGTINAACRIKYDYEIIDLTAKQNGNIDLPFETSSDSQSFGDGAYNCGYFGASSNPKTNENIDNEIPFSFSTSSPSPKVRIESGVYVGNIYYRKTYQLIGTVNI